MLFQCGNASNFLKGFLLTHPISVAAIPLSWVVFNFFPSFIVALKNSFRGRCVPNKFRSNCGANMFGHATISHFTPDQERPVGLWNPIKATLELPLENIGVGWLPWWQRSWVQQPLRSFPKLWKVWLFVYVLNRPLSNWNQLNQIYLKCDFETRWKFLWY